MNLVDELHAIAAVLTAAGIPYAICGGVAVTMHGATRSTKDLDVLVRPEDAARVFELVRPLGYVYAALPMTFDPGTPRERHVLRTKIDGTAHRWTRAGGVQRAGARVRGVRSAGTA